MSELLENRGVVVTGAGRGLGRAFAVAAADAGAGVVVNDIDLEEAERVVAEIEARGGRAVASGASVADWDQADSMVQACVDEFGSIDGLINNAITYRHFGPTWEQTGDTIRAEVEVAVVGTIYCGVQAMRRMKEQGRGSIINMVSRAMLGVAGMSTYVAVKGGVASATYAWALELLPHGVRVNAIAPSAHTRAHDLATEAGTIRPSQHAKGAPPELVAPAAVYLLSDLSERVTGQVLIMLGRRLGLLRHPRVFDRFEEREEWTVEELAATFERAFGDDLQPIGFEADRYQLADEDAGPT